MTVFLEILFPFLFTPIYDNGHTRTHSIPLINVIIYSMKAQRLTTTKTVCELVNIQHICWDLAPNVKYIDIHFHIFLFKVFRKKREPWLVFPLLMRFDFRFSSSLLCCSLFIFHSAICHLSICGNTCTV